MLTELATCDICLINPPWFTKITTIWNEIKPTLPPLGLLSIAAYLESNGLSVKIIDVNAEKLSVGQLEEKIINLKPKIVGITVVTATALQSNLIARSVKKINPAITVVFGGIHAETLSDECLRNKSVDIVVRGDGEVTFYNLCKAILNNLPFKELAGISFRSSKQEKTIIIRNKNSEFIKNLDLLPSPAYHLIDFKNYRPASGAYLNLPAINMLMTRGCPGKCSFCNCANTPVRTRNAKLIVEEVLILKDIYSIKELQFYDNTFTVDRANVLKFCALMQEKKANMGWSAFTRTDCIDKILAKEMKKAGCHQIMLGLESAETDVLKKANKPLKERQTEEAVKILQDLGIEARCAFVYGCEGETKKSMKKTLDFALKLKPDLAIFNIATPYPGTQLYRWAKKNNYLLHEEWAEYELSQPVIRLPTVSVEELSDFYRKSFKIFYRQPRVIWKRIRKVNSFRSLAEASSVFRAIMFGRNSRKVALGQKEWVLYKKSDFFDCQPDN